MKRSRSARRIQRRGAWQFPKKLRRHRYRLGFIVNPGGRGRLLFVGLNPSTASLTTSDPTVDVFCRARAVAGGFREMEIVNLFGLRSTDKRALLTAADPIGRGNDRHLTAACREADSVVVCWGAHFHPIVYDRATLVAKMVRRHARGPILAVALNADGSPGHPLYRRCTRKLIRFDAAI